MVSKSEILDEIRRTARANGGEPLGTARFERETGIKPYDWGRYWPRFGDAVQAAGFAPNAMQGAHSEEVLIGKLALLSRELGKFPTSREIETAHFRDPSIPTKKAFQRLGNKEGVVRMVLGYCSTHEGFDDVASFCTAVLDGAPKPRDDEDISDSAAVGEVYLFKSGRYFKIGRTKDTVRRGAEIRIQLPEATTLIHSIKTDDPAGVEAYWHRRFENKRMNGEWFDLDPADVRAFKRWRRIV